MRSNHGWKLVLASGLALSLFACNAPRSLPAVRDSGDRYYRHHEYDAALADYQEYISREPGDPAIRLALAKTLINVNRPAEAVEHAQLAYDQRPLNDDYIDTLARALFESGRTDEMLRLLRGTADSRGLPGDFIRLGQYQARIGDADNAVASLKHAAIVDNGRTLAPQLALADFYRSINDRPNELLRLRMALYLDSNHAATLARLRDLGEVPGPSLALQPEEM